MSWYKFMASDVPLVEYDNGVVNETYIDGKNAIYFRNDEDEDRLVNIKVEDDRDFAQLLTRMKYINYVELGTLDESMCEIIVDYIKKHMEKSNIIVLYDTWYNDKHDAEKRILLYDELTTLDIKDIWGQEFFFNNRCLIIKKF